MSFLVPILGFAFAFVLIIYREQIGDVFGDPDWMRPLGGVYFVIVYIAIFIMFWSIAYATDTTDILFKPVLWLFPTLTRRGIDAQPDLVY